MIGYDTEDKCYCLELTFNYGVFEYVRGTGLNGIAIGVDDPSAALVKAKELGFKVEGARIEGPDGYQYTVSTWNRDERFLFVSINVSDVRKSLSFYVDLLGMSHVMCASAPASAQATVAFSEAQVALCLTEIDSVHIEQMEGRHAIAMPEQRVREIYAIIESNNPELIVHPFRELHEKLGMLVLAIVKDFDGFEICLVSSETFDKAAKEACDWKEPDWESRRRFLDERAPASKKGACS